LTESFFSNEPKRGVRHDKNNMSVKRIQVFCQYGEPGYQGFTA
jgi:hypothetical protein